VAVREPEEVRDILPAEADNPEGERLIHPDAVLTKLCEPKGRGQSQHADEDGF